MGVRVLKELFEYNEQNLQAVTIAKEYAEQLGSGDHVIVSRTY